MNMIQLRVEILLPSGEKYFHDLPSLPIGGDFDSAFKILNQMMGNQPIRGGGLWLRSGHNLVPGPAGRWRQNHYFGMDLSRLRMEAELRQIFCSRLLKADWEQNFFVHLNYSDVRMKFFILP